MRKFHPCVLESSSKRMSDSDATGAEDFTPTEPNPSLCPERCSGAEGSCVGVSVSTFVFSCLSDGWECMSLNPSHVRKCETGATGGPSVKISTR